MVLKEFTAQELSGANNRNVQTEISQGLLTNYNGTITNAQKTDLLNIWRYVIGTAPTYQINPDKLREFYALKASFFGTVSDAVITAALTNAGATPGPQNFTATPAAQQAAAVAVATQTTETNFFTKYKTPLLIGSLLLLALAAYLYFKKR